MQLLFKILSGMANSSDLDQKLLKQSDPGLHKVGKKPVNMSIDRAGG